MVRFFRPYGKKRGERRTGSRTLGGYGEALFSLCLFVLGAVGLYLMLAHWLVPEWQANQNFVAARCEILEGRVQTDQTDNEIRYYPEIFIRYEAAGQIRTAWTYTITPQFHGLPEDAQKILGQFVVGQEYPCWYDPLQPDRVVLKKGFRWWLWLLAILPASFVVFGAVGLALALMQSGASTERRAMFSQRAAQLDLFDHARQPSGGLPTVPRRDDITESPGTQLAYRLPVDVSGRWRSAGMILLCRLWNTITAVAIYWLIADFVAGQGQWLGVAIIAPLATIGLAILASLVRRFWRGAQLGSVRLEISDHPLIPGESYEIVVSHTGRAPMRSLALQLVCEEEATYRQGTDTRTAIERVYENTIYRRREIPLQMDDSFEDRCILHVPPGTMHSFKSDHNQIRWDLVVRGDVAGVAEIQRRFAVIVQPMRNPAQ